MPKTAPFKHLSPLLHSERGIFSCKPNNINLCYNMLMETIDPSSNQPANPAGEVWSNTLSKDGEKPISNQAPDDGNGPDGDRPLTDEEILALKKQLVEYYDDDSKSWAENLFDMQKYFADQIKRSKSRGESVIPEQEYEKWAEDFEYEWQIIQRNLKRREKLIPFKNREEMIKYVGFTSLEVEAKLLTPLTVLHYSNTLSEDNTIEAYAGNYFHERRSELLSAINNSDLPEEEKNKDIDRVRGFWDTVSMHVYSRYKDNQRIHKSAEDAKRDDDTRVDNHNAVLQHLNDLNDLSAKYKTKSFTPRRLFWPNPRDKNHTTPDIQTRMLYDRYVVQGYYENAFKYEIEDYKRELEEAANYS